MCATKTDNAFLADKVDLRVNNLPTPREGEPMRVLDAYSGKGVIWDRVQRKVDFDIAVTKIDKRPDISTFRLKGNNTKIMNGLDLSIYDVIDLDAYGIPYDQLRVLFQKGYHGTVFVTFIQVGLGSIPHKMLYDLGFQKFKSRKGMTIFRNVGYHYFKMWLWKHGIKSVRGRHHEQKHYIVFKM